MFKYLPWLAGFVDGEGSFSLTVVERKGASGNLNLNIYVNASVHQHIKRRDILEKIKDHFNFGAVYNRENRMSHYQPTSRADTKVFIEAILPYLQIKHVPATVALKAIDILNSHTRFGGNLLSGQHVIPYESAIELVELCASINISPSTGARLKGRTREEMLEMVGRVYGKEVVPKQRSLLDCKGCGTPIERYLINANNTEHQFCSRACTLSWAKNEYNKDYQVNIPCSTCTKVFSRNKQNIKPGQNYCSMLCSRRSPVRRRIGKALLS